MMIRAIRLQDVRGFRNATLPLNALTVILGPNSAGKSTFGQALVALGQAHVGRYGVPSLTSERDPVDLGTHAELHRANAEPGPVIISLETGDGTVDLGFGGFGDPDAGWATSVKGADLALSHLGFSSDRLTLGAESGSPMEAAREEYRSIQQETGAEVERNEVDVDSPHTAKSFRRISRDVWEAELYSGERLQVELLLTGLRAVAVTRGGSLVDFPAPPLAHVIHDLERIAYLSPSRLPPAREFTITKRPRVGPCGEGTAELLFRSRESPASAMVEVHEPPGAPDDPDEVTKQLRLGASWLVSPMPLHEAVSFWMRHLGLAGGVVAARSAAGHTISVDMADGQPPKSLVDVGFGVSQILPVLVAGLTLPKGATLVVEQPECQLHPRAAELLADFLCSMVKAGRRLLVETHSEALFHRLRYRAAMDDSLAKETGVWFLDAPVDGCCCEPRNVDISPGGELRWPVDFLGDGWRIEVMLRAASIGRRKAGVP